MPLKEKVIAVAKPKQKEYRLSDGRGLYLLIAPEGGKYWRFKYRFEGRERWLSFGVYPDVTLTVARERHQAARTAVANGIDPKVERVTKKAAEAVTFKLVAEEWKALQLAGTKPIGPDTVKKIEWLFRDYLFPAFGDRPIANITTADIYTMLKRVEATGKIETTHRCLQYCRQVFAFAKVTNRVKVNPSHDLEGALAANVAKHHPGITNPARIGELLVAMDGYQGQPATIAALKLCAHVFVRPGELRMAEWSEVDLERAQWRLSAERMKMDEPLIVPLSRQAVAILRELHALTGRGRYVFQNYVHLDRPMSENTVSSALRRLGFPKEEHTWHGFRTTASTRLNEMGYNTDFIELQLSHQEVDKSRAAYNRALRLQDRTKMMQEWSDELDALRAAWANRHKSQAA